MKTAGGMAAASGIILAPLAAASRKNPENSLGFIGCRRHGL
jgi:hypothetical protein